MLLLIILSLVIIAFYDEFKLKKSNDIYKNIGYIMFLLCSIILAIFIELNFEFPDPLKGIDAMIRPILDLLNMI